MTRTCFAPHFMYNRSSDDTNFDNRLNSVGFAGLTDSDYMNQCRILSDLANCLKVYNLTGCVTGPVLTSVVTSNYTMALMNATAARSMNCVNNTRSIFNWVKCPLASQGNPACMFNSTNNQCPTVQSVMNCQIPAAKMQCGLLAVDYTCSSARAAYSQCGDQICNMTGLDTISMDKQMLFAAGGRNTVSLVLGITVLGLAFW
ncbi:hypothetical protein FO519_009886 [Halicephalobus sp. NKZ332]|nr:hypothetical protein FO519_009886 [Halicephalobus sp. NKZ332]